VKAPCPWSNLMPSGGVTPEYDNLKAWFDAGVTCVGMGSQLVKASYAKDKNYDVLAQKVKEALQLIKEIRN